jgi:hypothetical protein
MKVTLQSPFGFYFFYNEKYSPSSSKTISKYSVFKVKILDNGLIQFIDERNVTMCVTESKDTQLTLTKYSEGWSIKGTSKFIGINSFGKALIYNTDDGLETKWVINSYEE